MFGVKGLTLIPAYFGQYVTSGFSYRRIPFERQAEKVENEYRKEWKARERRRESPPPLPGPFGVGGFGGAEVDTPYVSMVGALNINMAEGF